MDTKVVQEIRDFINKEFDDLLEKTKSRNMDILAAKLVQAKNDIYGFIYNSLVKRDGAKPITTFYTETHNSVNHPTHYCSHPSGIECIDIARYYCFSIGNAIKYLWRAGLKKDASLTNNSKEIEDLNKAIWYIKDRIKQLQNGQAET